MVLSGGREPPGSVCASRSVSPLTASSLGIVGDDAEGVLLLAVFPLPEPDAVQADGVQHLSVTLEGGQTVALAMALAEGTSREAQAYVIQLAYAEPPAVDMSGAEPSVVKALLPKLRPGAIHDGDAGETHLPST